MVEFQIHSLLSSDVARQREMDRVLASNPLAYSLERGFRSGAWPHLSDAERLKVYVALLGWQIRILEEGWAKARSEIEKLSPIPISDPAAPV